MPVEWPEAKKPVRALEYPSKYPEGGSYSMLLAWHLRIWGTYPGGSKSKNTAPWNEATFAERVIPTQYKDHTWRTSIRNWTKENGTPPKDEFICRKIQEVLFGKRRCFKDWYEDLWAAQNTHYERQLPLNPPVWEDDEKEGPAPRASPPVPLSMEVELSGKVVVPPLSRFKFGLEAERLKIEQRANARRSAKLLAVEAERSNRAANYNAGMRFALAGWLEAAKENITCPPEVRAELERGARSIRPISRITGSQLHGYYKVQAGDEGLILSDERILYILDIYRGNITVILEIGEWFTISKNGKVSTYYSNKERVSIKSLSEFLGKDIEVELIWPLMGETVLYRKRNSRDTSLTISTNGDHVTYLNEEMLRVWSIAGDENGILENSLVVRRSGSIFFSPDGSKFLSNKFSDKFALWNISPLYKIRDLESICTDINYIDSAIFLDESRKLFIISPNRSGSSKVQVVCLEIIKLIGEFDVKKPSALSPDGSAIAGCDGRFICVYSSTGKLIYNDDYNNQPIWWLGFSADGEFLFVYVPGDILVRDARHGFDLLFSCHKNISAEQVAKFFPQPFIRITGVLSSEVGDQNIHRHIFHGKGSLLEYFQFTPFSQVVLNSGTSMFAVIEGNKVKLFDGDEKLLGQAALKGCELLKLSRDGTVIFAFSSGEFSAEARTGDLRLSRIDIFDANFAMDSDLDYLVEFVCNVKLKGAETFVDEDFEKARYKSVPFDVVDQCRAFIRTSLTD